MSLRLRRGRTRGRPAGPVRERCLRPQSRRGAARLIRLALARRSWWRLSYPSVPRVPLPKRVFLSPAPLTFPGLARFGFSGRRKKPERPGAWGIIKGEGGVFVKPISEPCARPAPFSGRAAAPAPAGARPCGEGRPFRR